ncbi:MAG: hypothetical protein JWO11_3742, partial [Nocardioides sp.]|nr:hypothetical protein [Nocardioides sp.]
MRLWPTLKRRVGRRGVALSFFAL